MKKIRNRVQFRRYQRKRQRATEWQRISRALDRRGGGTRPIRRSRGIPAGFTRVAACPLLSMTENPEGTIGFFNRLHSNLEKKRPTYVYLKDVGRIDYDAIVVLLSIMVRFKSSGVRFSGDFPANRAANLKLKGSGFFELLYKEEIEARERYRLRGSSAMSTHGQRQVDASLGASVIAHATASVWGSPRRSQGIQRVLLELMQNTNNHASPSHPGEKHWWLSVSHLPKTKQVKFVFLDLGVGVFRSLDQKPDGNKWFGWRDKIGKAFSATNNAEILRLILAGELHRTVTGQHFRGKGLPGIEETFQRNWISGLVIITNDVYADVSAGVYRSLPEEFKGTLISWELNAANHSTPEV